LARCREWMQVVTDKDGEQFTYSDDVPPSYAEASRYTHHSMSVSPLTDWL